MLDRLPDASIAGIYFMMMIIIKLDAVRILQKRGLFPALLLACSMQLPAQQGAEIINENGNGPKGTWHLFADSMNRKTVVKSVFSDPKNTVWFVCNDGLRIYSDTGFAFFDESNGLVNNYISCTYTDRKGNKWFGHYEGPSKDYYSGPGVQTIVDAALISRITDGGVSMFNGTEWKQFRRKDGNFNAANIRTIFEDSNGRIWFSCSGSLPGMNSLIHPAGISVFEHEKMTNLNETDTKPVYKFVNRIVETADGQIQFYSDNGGAFSFRDGRFKDMSTMTGYISGLGHVIWQDSKKNVWLFLENKIKRVDGNEFIVYKEKQGVKIPHNLFFSFSETKNGGIVAVGTLGICVYDGTAWRSYKYDKEETTAPPDYEKRHAAYDSRGNLWVYINGNFGFFDGEKWNPQNRYLTSRFYIDSGDRIWAPGKKGMTVISDGKTQKFESLTQINGIMEDANKNIWLNQNGKALWFRDGKTEQVNFPDNLKSAGIQMIFRDENGRVWFFTDKGVCYFRYAE